jgi:cyclophilin family peptidyl-prolyl cis-trans isomerase
LPVSVSVKSGPATISGNTVTLTGAGTVVLAANQSGNANYLATTEVTTSFTVAQSSQTINAFTTVASQTFGNGATVTITPPTASSSLPVSVSVKSGPATISGNTVTLSGVGTVVLAANQSGNANYTAASEVTTSFSVAQGNQAINFGALTNRTFGNAPFALNATASSGLPVSYSSASGNISLSSNMVTILGAGTATITASQNGNSNWSEAPSITNMMVIAKTSNTIASFTTVANQTFRNGAIVTITPPSASSTLPVTISVKSGPATISGNTVTLTGVGMVVLAANQAGNANYLAATEVTTSFSVSAGSQTITFPSIPSQPISTNQITLNASASSGLPVDYSIISGAASLVSSNTLALNGIGTITVQASQVGNTNWSVATPVKQIFVVSRGSQSITFTPLASNTFGQAPYRLTNATASSGLPVSYASSVPAVATIVSNNTLTIVGAGTTTITASQPGNTNWAAATNVARTLVVLKASNTISGFAPVADRTYVPNAVITLPAPLPAASSRLPVTISVKSGPALMSGTNAVRMTGGGTVVLAANQPGNANYLAAPEVTNSFQILQATQSIAPFTQVTPKTNGTAPFTVTLPAASSALPVRLSVLSGPATVSNSTVTLRGAGLVTLAANQNGNSNYLAAPQVTTSFIVARGNQAITFAALSNRTYGGAPFAILGMSSSGLPLTYTSSDTNVAIVTTNSVADVVTDLGDIPMELLTQSAPVTVANFISFADKGAYDNSFFHRSVPGFVIQGGGYVASTNLAPISAKAPITNEYSLSNTRGTVAMALVGTNPNSATTQWFINLTNNSSILDNTNIAGNPPFAVFARVLGKGLSVVDSIVSLPIYNADAPFNELPAQGVTNGQLNLKVSNLVSMDIGIVRGPAVVIVGAGTATIVASQNGNSNYLAATPVTNTLVVGRVRALVALSNLRHTYDGVAKSVIVTTTPRSLPVTVSYRNSSAAPVNAGNYPVMATVNDSNYSGVATGILAVARATQNITFAPPSSVNFSTNGVINLEATSSSGLPVTYTSSIPAVLSISGSKAYMKKRGSSIITATQAGNSNIAPAVSVRKIIRIW